VTDRPAPPAVPTTGALARLADEILPALVARLDVSDLGELEVRHDGWRVRLRRSLEPRIDVHGASTGSAGPGHGPVPEPPRGATSPAVGYFVPDERTPVGRTVAGGDVLGWIEVLGVRHEVVAPHDGVVGRSLAEAGQAVEYGQELVIIDGPRRAPDAAPDAPGAPDAAAAPD
jgi:biotin carboxyl carrier protein